MGGCEESEAGYGWVLCAALTWEMNVMVVGIVIYRGTFSHDRAGSRVQPFLLLRTVERRGTHTDSFLSSLGMPASY